MTETQPTPDVAERFERARTGVAELRERVSAGFLGHREVVDLLLSCILADGHALLEGAPGLGKTTLVKSLAGSLGIRFQRVQFTPDLMPGDILGMRILDEDASGARTFRFEAGPIFTQVLLADEVNRATPRTQSALLEAMQERQVTMFGETRALEDPFFVIATQNPIEMEGTYPLPEAQLDRFLCKIELQAPGEDELVKILAATTGAPPAEAGEPLGVELLRDIRRLVREIPTSTDVMRLAARIVLRTDPRHERAPDDVKRHLRFGASPRGGQSLLLLGKARALLQGRPWVSDEDVVAVAPPALRHRVVFSYEGEASGVHADELIRQAAAAAQS
ncbi:MAG: AAA family ATPase [Planctomycetota bacterium]